MSGISPVRAWWARRPPAAGAAVTATGIVSVGLRQAGAKTLSRIALVLLVLDLAWYVVLLAAEVARPRLRYDVRRWATVFPMGMTAAATLSVAAVFLRWLNGLGQVLVWVAVAAWLAVAAGAVLTTRAALTEAS